MSKQKLLGILENLGLSSKEASVYIAALGLGSASIQELSTESGLKRTSVYPIVKRLQEQSLLLIDSESFKRRYLAATPLQLEEIVRIREQQLKDSMPELLALFNLKATDSSIRYYQGKLAIRNIYNRLVEDVRPGDFYYIFSNNDQFIQQDPEFFENFFVRRAKKFREMPAPSIDLRMLILDSPSAQDRKKHQAQYFEKVKILPKGTHYNVNSVVIPSRMVLHNLTPPIFAIVIENQNLIDLQRQMYELIWNVIP